MLGLCRMLLRDPVEAEDAAQQAFLSAYRSLLAGNRPAHPAAWLATIARNECWARVQQRMRQPVAEVLPEELVSTLPGPVEEAARKADLAALVAAIGALPAQQRDALLMREFSGLSYAELAAALSVSEPAVESLLVRARRELRLRLQPVYAAGIAPFVMLREWLGRLGAGTEPTLGAVAKLSAVSLAAKLAAGLATVAVVGGVAVSGDDFKRGAAAVKADAVAAVGVSDAAAGTSALRSGGTASMPDGKIEGGVRRGGDEGDDDRSGRGADRSDPSPAGSPSTPVDRRRADGDDRGDDSGDDDRTQPRSGPSGSSGPGSGTPEDDGDDTAGRKGGGDDDTGEPDDDRSDDGSSGESDDESGQKSDDRSGSAAGGDSGEPEGDDELDDDDKPEDVADERDGEEPSGDDPEEPED